MEPGPVRWLKGHGTHNDFVLLPDLDGRLHGALDAEAVSWLCDRHEGLGADGLLRVVRSRHVEAARHLPSDVEWFMDYRNADGSIAEMCGNGVRVQAHYLLTSGLASLPMRIGTRGGIRTVSGSPGSYTATMGRAEMPESADVRVQIGERSWPATPVMIPNPHAVVLVDDVAQGGTLAAAPLVTPASVFPAGANVELVSVVAPRHLQMRVHERGVGETLSCGTGACAAAVVAMRRDGAAPGETYLVDVPGGRLSVTQQADGEVLLSGPAVLTAEGEASPLPGAAPHVRESVSA